LQRVIAVSSGAAAVARLISQADKALGTDLVRAVLLGLSVAPSGLNVDELAGLASFSAENGGPPLPSRVYLVISYFWPLIVQGGRFNAWMISSTALTRLVREYYAAKAPDALSDTQTFLTELFLRQLKKQGCTPRVAACLPDLLLGTDEEEGGNRNIDTKSLVSALLSHPDLWLNLIEQQQDDGGRAARRVWIIMTDAAHQRLCETGLAFVTAETKRYLERMRLSADIDERRMADKHLTTLLARAPRLAKFAELQNDRHLSLHLFELCYQLQVCVSRFVIAVWMLI
jgi:hypothetical protein